MRKHIFASFLLLSPAIAFAAPPDTVFLEELTWTEVRDLLAAGKTTVLVASAGNEQNGPHMVLGKHEYIMRHTADRIARKLGNALVAPIVTYVPEGAVDPPSGHMRYPGTITLPNVYFMKIYEYAARSLKAHGFTDIVFLGDSGGNQDGMEEVALALNAEWRGGKTRVHFVPEYYSEKRLHRLAQDPGRDRREHRDPRGNLRHFSASRRSTPAHPEGQAREGRRIRRKRSHGRSHESDRGLREEGHRLQGRDRGRSHPEARPRAVSDLFEDVRRSAPPQAWSKGVTLAREGAVSVESEDGEEIVARVALPGSPLTPRVSLFPDDGEWECDCGSVLEACEHAAAVVIARRQGIAAKPRRNPLEYRLYRSPEGVRLERGASVDSRFQPIELPLESAHRRAVRSLAGGSRDREGASRKLPGSDRQNRRRESARSAVPRAARHPRR